MPGWRPQGRAQVVGQVGAAPPDAFLTAPSLTQTPSSDLHKCYWATFVVATCCCDLPSLANCRAWRVIKSKRSSGGMPR